MDENKIEITKRAILDRRIQNILDYACKNFGYCWVIGKSFGSQPCEEYPFIYSRTIYMPNWTKQKFLPMEFEWLVFHELAHIVHNHRGKNPRKEEPEADLFAASCQGNKQYGLNAICRLCLICARGDLDARSHGAIGLEHEAFPITYGERIKILKNSKVR